MVADKIHLVYSMTVPVPFQRVCPMTRFPLSANCFAYYSTSFFFVVLNGIYMALILSCCSSGWLDLSGRAAVAVVHENDWAGCMLEASLAVLNEPYSFLFVS